MPHRSTESKQREQAQKEKILDIGDEVSVLWNGEYRECLWSQFGFAFMPFTV